MRRGRLFRAVALVESWLVTATTVWAAAPPVLPRAQAPAAPIVRRWSTWPQPDRARRSAPEAWTPATGSAAPRAAIAGQAPLMLQAAAAAPSSVTLFGPQKYLRTSGAPNVYNATVSVAPWVIAPFKLRVQNGEPSGANRVSSADISLNSTQVSGPSDWNVNVPGFEKTVTLTPSTALKVTLSSKPASYFFLTLVGTNGDHRAPDLALTIPAPGSKINTPRPRLVLRYTDSPGTGDPAASGIDLATLRVWIDEVDRTALFTRGAAEASAELPQALALTEGAHTVRAEVRDVAGNTGTTSSTFTVDLTPPQAAIAQPVRDSHLNDATPAVRVTYADAHLVTASVRLTLLRPDGGQADLTPLLQVGASEASGEITPALADGIYRLRLTVGDQATNATTVESSFELDTVRPTYRVERPGSGEWVASGMPALRVCLSDDRGFLASPLTFGIDGQDRTAALAFEANPAGTTAACASGTLPAAQRLSDGPHEVQATVTDRAGNVSLPVPHAFQVDTVAPTATIEAPEEGTYVPLAPTPIRVRTADVGGSLAALTIRIDGADRTSDFAVVEGVATASVPLADGRHEVVADVRDAAGNTGTDTATFHVDTHAPELALATPAEGSIHGASPITLTGTVADLDPETAVLCAVGEGGTGVPATVAPYLSAATREFSCALPLTETANTLSVTATDRNAHATTKSRGVVLDTTAPQLAITAPADGTYTAGNSITVEGTLVDATAVSVLVGPVIAAVSGTHFTAEGVPLGAGPDQTLAAVGTDAAGNSGQATVAVRIDRGSPVVEIQGPRPGAFLSVSALEVSGTVVDTSPLVVEANGRPVLVERGEERDLAAAPRRFSATLPVVDGPLTVRVVARDRALNQAEAEVPVTIDATAPVVTITAPETGALSRETHVLVTGFVRDATPTTLRHGQVVIPLGADGTFTYDAPLPADGSNEIVLSAVDAANNPGGATVQVVRDTVPPQLAIASPQAAVHLSALASIAFTYGDPNGTGIDLARVRLWLDGTERTSTLAIGPEGATLALDGALTDDLHVVEAVVHDRAGNERTARAEFTVDSIAPALGFTTPAADAFLGETTPAAVLVYTDANGAHIASVRLFLRRVLAGEAEAEITAAFTVGTTEATGRVPAGLADGAWELRGEAKDRAGNLGAATRRFSVDTRPPALIISSPAEGSFRAASPITVAGTVADSDPQVAVACAASEGAAGTPATVATFAGDSPREFTCAVAVTEAANTIFVTATDRNGHRSTQTRPVVLDTTRPAIRITSPTEGAWSNAASVTVAGEVSDANLADVRVGPVTAVVAAGTFTAEGVPLGVDPTQTLTATARDAADNEESHSVTLQVDREAPVVQVTVPSPATFHSVSTLAVRGTVSDRRTVSVEVNGVTAALEGQAGDPLRSFTAQLPVSDGPLTLVATAKDAATNSGTSAPVAVTVDATAPVLAFTTPTPGPFTNDSTPSVRLTYLDADEAVGGRLRFFLMKTDPAEAEVEVTSSFQAAGGEAIGTLAVLAEGTYALRAQVTDRADNPGSAQATFTVDTRAPTVRIDSPVEGNWTAATDITVSGEVLDAHQAVVRVNGVLAVVTGTRFVAEGVSLGAQSDQTITAVATDPATNEGRHAVSLHVDRVAPVVTIDNPQPGAYLSTTNLTVSGSVVDAAPVTVEVNGTAAAVEQGGEPNPANTPRPFSVALAVTDGPLTLAAAALDAAQNPGGRSLTITIDATAPVVVIEAPAEGAFSRETTTTLTGRVVDATPVTLRHGATEIPLGPEKAFTYEAALATEGENTFILLATDAAGNPGSTTRKIIRDTVPPTLSLAVPGPGTHLQALAAISLSYADPGGTGVDPATLQVLIDGTDRTAWFAPGAEGADAALAQPLADGEHRVQATVADHAGNPKSIDERFTLDAVPPQLSFAAAPPQFTNVSSPQVRLTYTDAIGTDPSTVHLYLKKDDAPEAEVTPLFQIGPAEATATFVPALADGAYALRAEAKDKAGNRGTASVEFTVDTVAPTYRVETPASGGFLATTSPPIAVSYEDERSGIDTTRVQVLVDGVDIISRLTVAAAGASGTPDPLGQGLHQVAARVFDRAGNQAAPVPHSFTIDTTAPTVTIETPTNGAYSGERPLAVRITFGDGSGSGIEPSKVHVFVDDVERTPAFAVSAGGATASLSLDDAPSHTIRATVEDRAGNPASASSSFTLDTRAPVIAVTTPAKDSYHRVPAVELAGTITDADEQLTAKCGASPATLSGAPPTRNFVCTLSLSEGRNDVAVSAEDRLHHAAQEPWSLILDTIPPQVNITVPAQDDTYTSATSIEVSGTVTDASPVTLTVNGATVPVSGGTFSTTVALGATGELAIAALAEDAAGNPGSATRRVRVDRAPPVVKITSPTSTATLATSLTTVTGTVDDSAPVLVDVNGTPADVGPRRADGLWPFQAQVPLGEGLQPITATARDGAANPGSDSIEVRVDTTPPLIVITEPNGPFVTRASTVRVAGTVSDATPVTLTIGTLTIPVTNGAFAVDYPLPQEGPLTIQVSATDAAGHAGPPVQLTGTVDRTPPTLTVTVPQPGVVFGSLPVTVMGFVSDATETTVTVDGELATRTQTAWQSQIGSLAEGPHTFHVVATDAAGNSTPVDVPTALDLGPPEIEITSPAGQTLTRESSIQVSGTARARSSVTVTVNGASVPVVGESFTTTVALAEGDTDIVAVATSAAQRTDEARVRVTRDSTPPVVSLQAPDRITRGGGGQAVASAADSGSGLAQVVITVNGSPIATFTAPPFAAAIAVPQTAQAGDILTLVAQASDRAGNSATSAPRQVRVSSDGVVVGQVLDDTTGLPLEGATVRLVASGTEVTTDERGAYSLPANDATAVLRMTKDGHTSVDRAVTVLQNEGTMPIDARLTKLRDVEVMAAAGVVAEGVTLTGAAGARLRLTPLSVHGLPGLLPLGYSPLAAFDVRSEEGSGDNFQAAFSGLLETTLHLVQYNLSLRAWTMGTRDLAPADGTLTSPVSAPGTYALVAVDPQDPPAELPAAGETLGDLAEPTLIPATAVTVAPRVPVSPQLCEGCWFSWVDQTNRPVARVGVFSAEALPSGTVIQARSEEHHKLKSGAEFNEDPRTQDLLLTRLPALAQISRPEGAPEHGLYATFPARPARWFPPNEYAEGQAGYDIFSGRSNARGQIGGNEAVLVTAGTSQVAVAAGSLAENTAVFLDELPLASWPSSPNLVPLADLGLDLAGNVLSITAELSVASPGTSPEDTLLIVRATRIQGVQRLVIASLAEERNGRIVSKAYPGLPGIVAGGRYIFYRSAIPLGFVAGTVRLQGTGVKALVEGGGLPFIAHATTSGSYLLAAQVGAAAVQARMPTAAFVASGTRTVTANQTAQPPLDLALEGEVITPTVSPADRDQGVARHVQIELTTATPLNPATVSADNATLVRVNADDSTTPVTTRFVLAPNGRALSVIPTGGLEPDANYRFQASGLTDVFGAVVRAVQVTFRTKPDVAPVYDLEAIQFSMPNEEGLISLTAPAGTLPPGSEVLVLDASNGIVVTFTADNDGAIGVLFPATFPGTIDDRLLVTITLPDGRTISFERSSFVNPLTGETAVGPGGGTVKGPDGVELRIPEEALDKGATFKLSTFDGEAYPERPDIAVGEDGQPKVRFGGGLRIEASREVNLRKEAKIAFAVPPDAAAAAAAAGLTAKDAFYYVVRRVENADGKVSFETIDHAFIQGVDADARVVTASWPLIGFVVAGGVSLLFLMWSLDAQRPGKPLSGTVTGLVRRVVWDSNANAPEYQPVTGAKVRVWKTPIPLLPDTATTQGLAGEPGRFTLWEWRYMGGPITLAVTLTDFPNDPNLCDVPHTAADDPVRCVTAYGIDPLDPATPGPLGKYEHIATANVTYPALQPPSPPPAVQIAVKKVNPNGTRTEILGGIVPLGTPLVLEVSAGSADVKSVTLQGKECAMSVQVLFNEVDLRSDPICQVSHVGTYTVGATALGPGEPLRSSKSFLVVSPGGNNSTAQPGPPKIVSITPTPNAAGVPVTILPQLVFSEPVKIGSVGAVTLAEEATPSVTVPITLLGVGPTGDVVNLTNDSSSPVTSITVQPLVGLEYGQVYRVSLGDGIVDLDAPTPSPLDPQSFKFTTFKPEGVGGTADQYGSPGIVALGDYAYLVQNNFYTGTLRAYDISDPSSPSYAAGKSGYTVMGRPVDLAGLEEGEGADKTRTVAVVTGATVYGYPSNLWLFDVTPPTTTNFLGAASFTSGPAEGSTFRVALHGGFAYAATYRKGIQVMDLSSLRSNFDALGEVGSQAHGDAMRKLSAAGQGFGQDAVVQTVPVTTNGQADHIYDLKAGQFVFTEQGQTEPSSQRLVMATGLESALIVVNPQMATILYQDQVPKKTTPAVASRLESGTALALGTVAGGTPGAPRRSAVLVAGNGMAVDLDTGNPQAGFVLAVVDVSDPTTPAPLSIVLLKGLTSSPTDVVMTEELAVVASNTGAVIVSIANPSQPRVLGTIVDADGNALVAGRLVLTPDGLLLSSLRSLFNGEFGLGGIRVAALGDIAIIEKPRVFAVDRSHKSAELTQLKFKLIPKTLPVETAEVDVFAGDSPTPQAPIAVGPFINGAATYTIPTGSTFNADVKYQARLVINRNLGEKERISARQNLRPARFDILDTEEVVLAPPGGPASEVVKVFNGAPDLTIDSHMFVLGNLPDILFQGGGTTAVLKIMGTVTSAIAPIPRVFVNEETVTVTPLDDGPDGMGPFRGGFEGLATVGPQSELVTVYVVDAINHVTTQSLRVDPQVSLVPDLISSRTATVLPKLMPGSSVATPQQFRVELKDKGSKDPHAQVAVETVAESKTITLRREGDVFRSARMLALPSTLTLPSGTPQGVQEARLKVKLGVRPRFRYETVEEKAIVSGVALVNSAGQPADRIDPVPSTGYAIEMGRPGIGNDTLEVTVSALRSTMEDLPAGDGEGPPTSRTISLARASNDPAEPGFNLYRASGSEAALPLMAGFNSTASSNTVRVVPFGRLRASGAGGDVILPVESGANQVRWQTEKAEALFSEDLSFLISQFTALGAAPLLPRAYAVTQRAAFLRNGTPIPGLEVSGFMDRRINLGTNDYMTALTPLSGQPTFWPLQTSQDGVIKFRVKTSALDDLNSLPVSGAVLTLTDRVGIRALNPSGEVLPPVASVADVTSAHGQQFTKTLPLIAGYASEGGIPRRTSLWYKRFAQVFTKQVVGNDPSLLAVRQVLGQSLAGKGYSEEQLDDIYSLYILGASIGLARGAVGAFTDSVMGVVDLVRLAGPALNFLSPDQDTIVKLVMEADPDEVTRALLDPAFVERQRTRLLAVAEFLKVAAALASRDEMQVLLTDLAVSSAVGSLNSEVQLFAGYLDLAPGTPKYGALLHGYIQGAVAGYAVELIAQAGAGGSALGAVVADGLAATMPLMVRASQANNLGKFVGAMRKVSKGLAVGDGPPYIQVVSKLIKFLDALGPNTFNKWLAEIGGVSDVAGVMSKTYRLVHVYEAAESARLQKLAAGLAAANPEHVAEAIVTMANMTTPEYRGAAGVVVVSLDTAEDFAGGVSRAVDLRITEPQFAAGIEGSLRNVKDAETFWPLFAGAEPDIIKGATRLSCP